MEDTVDVGIGFVLGVVVTLLTALSVFHYEESNCQQFHNVADCYWGQSPFLPAVDQ
jgi:hypothetical protein